MPPVDVAEAPDEGLARLQAADRELGSDFCRGCGCTDDYACVGGCYWIDTGRCSACSSDPWVRVRWPGTAG